MAAYPLNLSKLRQFLVLSSYLFPWLTVLSLSGMPVMIKASEVEKNLAWEAQQAAKQQQSNQEAAGMMTGDMMGMMGGQTVPAGLGACRLQVRYQF